MSEKAVNYTPDQVKAIVDGYKAGEPVETLAALVGKTVRSVVAKLSREGVYQAKAQVASERVTKAHLIAQIAQNLGVSAESLDSFEKASKPQLELLLRHWA